MGRVNGPKRKRTELESDGKKTHHSFYCVVGVANSIDRMFDHVANNVECGRGFLHIKIKFENIGKVHTCRT